MIFNKDLQLKSKKLENMQIQEVIYFKLSTVNSLLVNSTRTFILKKIDKRIENIISNIAQCDTLEYRHRLPCNMYF